MQPRLIPYRLVFFSTAAMLMGCREKITVSSRSMEPSLPQGSILEVKPPPKSIDLIHRGDLVVIKSPIGTGSHYARRVVGLPGETIEALEAALVINGKAVALEAMGFPTSAKIQKGLGKKWTCSDNELLLFGDNLANALDGRDYGPTQFSEVTGTIVGLVKGE